MSTVDEDGAEMEIRLKKPVNGLKCGFAGVIGSPSNSEPVSIWESRESRNGKAACRLDIMDPNLRGFQALQIDSGWIRVKERRVCGVR